jgi:GNAT superfamily N-acetyltransferase
VTPVPDDAGANIRSYTSDEAAARAAAGDSGSIYTVDVPASRADEIAPLAETGERQIARDVADAIEQKAEAPMKATVAPDAVDDWIISRAMIPETGPSGYRVVQADDGSFATVVLRGHDGRAKAGLLIPTHPEALENFGGVISYVSPDIRRKGVATRLYNIAQQSGLPIAKLSGRSDLTPDGAAFARAWRDRSAPLRAEGAERFDDGVNGPGARTVTQSLDHDLRMAAKANPDELVRVSDEGGDIRLADVIDDLDADDAALIAARACMT